VILTGMGADGAVGLKDLKRAGGHVLAQDEGSSVVYGMPKEAVATGAVDQILHLDDIAPTIAKGWEGRARAR
jgi:two-component system chemotaxis response regulator CheB